MFLAALLLGPHAAYGHALFGFTLLSGLVLGQWWGWIPNLLPVGVVNSAEPINGHYVFTVLVVQGTAMGVAAYLVSGLTKMLHDGESQLSRANAELSKLSQLRRAFLHTALHDLKAPFDAIAMIMYNLEAGSPDRLTEQQAKWVARCRQRLNEVSAFLRDFQTIASLDGATLTREETPINVAAMLHQLVRENEDLADERMHEVFLDAPGSLPAVIGIERLLHEAAANLITNAIKYTPWAARSLFARSAGIRSCGLKSPTTAWESPRKTKRNSLRNLCVCITSRSELSPRRRPWMPPARTATF